MIAYGNVYKPANYEINIDQYILHLLLKRGGYLI